MNNRIPETFDVSLQADQYSAACRMCPWATAIVPSGDNQWWFHSLRVHNWHFCKGLAVE